VEARRTDDPDRGDRHTKPRGAARPSPNERFLVRENADGSLLLQPARVVTEAQHEYDTDPELRDLLSRAFESPTVQRDYRRRGR